MSINANTQTMQGTHDQFCTSAWPPHQSDCCVLQELKLRSLFLSEAAQHMMSEDGACSTRRMGVLLVATALVAACCVRELLAHDVIGML